MTPTTRDSGNVRVRLSALHVRAAMCSHGAVHRQRFGQHDHSAVDGHLADAAMERR